MVVQSWHLDHNLLHFRLNPENPREAFIVVLKSKKPVASDIVPGKQTTCVVYRLDLDTNKLSKITKAKHFQTLAVNPTGKLVAIAAGKKLLLWNAADNSVRKFPHDQEISVIDFHPTAAYLAYGDQMGRILLLYYNSGAEGQAPVASTLHWHAHRVGALRFALDGEQLLSGGEESVLVVWHLQTRQKSFLPRLGAEIAALETSPDGTLIAIGLADGSVKVVTISNLTILQSIEGMRFGKS